MIELKNAIRSVQNNNIKPIYFLKGGDHFLQNFFIEKICNSLFINEKINKNLLTSNEMAGKEIIESLLSSDLFSTKKLFIGSIFGLILAYFIRFFSLSFNGIKSSYEKINTSIDESAYLLGYTKIKTFLKIHVPYLKTNIILIMLLISLEVIKELPITMILRPFNYETFATQAYVYASQDLLEAAALPSLFLIFWSTFLIILSSRYILSKKN